MKQFELDIAKKLNEHLDVQDALQDEVKAFFQEWFEKNLDPVELVNDPSGYLSELEEKALAIFQKKFLPIIESNGSRFGNSVNKKYLGTKAA